jgi:hypothetical protein
MKALFQSISDFFRALNSAQKVGVIVVLALIAFDFFVFSPLASAGGPKGPAQYAVGDDIDVSITLVTTDAKALACASTEMVGPRHCEFETDKQRWSKGEGRPSPNDLLAPYKTTDDQLFLVAGLFSEPALAQRLAIDPPNFGHEHARFVANCKLHIEGKIEKVGARWQPSGQFGPVGPAWVGTLSACLLSDA